MTLYQKPMALPITFTQIFQTGNQIHQYSTRYSDFYRPHTGKINIKTNIMMKRWNHNVTLLGLCVWQSCEKGVKSVWKKATMWNQCWQKYKFTISAFHMHVNFLTCMWNFVIHMKKFCHMGELFSMHFITCEIFSHMWNNFVMHVKFEVHMHNRCYVCEIFHMHVNTFRHVRVSRWNYFRAYFKMQPLWTTFLWKCHKFRVNTPWKLQN